MTAQQRQYDGIQTASDTGPGKLAGLINHQPWMADGICNQTDPDSFFPEKGHQDDGHTATRVCTHCPVIAECFAYAIANDERFGVWGGTTERQRRRLIRRQQQAQKKAQEGTT